MRDIGHFVGGKVVKGTSGRFGDVFDPNTGEVQAKVALAKHAEVEHAMAWAATLILVTLILMINILVRFLTRKRF